MIKLHALRMTTRLKRSPDRHYNIHRLITIHRLIRKGVYDVD